MKNHFFVWALKTVRLKQIRWFFLLEPANFSPLDRSGVKFPATQNRPGKN